MVCKSTDSETGVFITNTFITVTEVVIILYALPYIKLCTRRSVQNKLMKVKYTTYNEKMRILIVVLSLGQVEWILTIELVTVMMLMRMISVNVTFSYFFSCYTETLGVLWVQNLACRELRILGCEFKKSKFLDVDKGSFSTVRTQDCDNSDVLHL